MLYMTHEQVLLQGSENSYPFTVGWEVAFTGFRRHHLNIRFILILISFFRRHENR